MLPMTTFAPVGTVAGALARFIQFSDSDDDPA